ncbi:membrane protein FxsA [Laribacter hongkongensis]|uniref:FxsA family protein n=1 Tax=Laribacter hongkongensis TaxID=168471 RepID=UPI001EFCB4DA|nr:FxsA family protein [Laribacter hongkongensis]MCG9064053.1 membrane protein FxsA [Laribacter hongkongensis]
MRIFLLLLLAFPFVELALLISLADWIGAGGVFLYLVLSALLGIVMLRNQKLGALLTLFSVMCEGRASVWQLMWPLRYLLAGALFVLPGILSEVAAVLLLLPFKGPALGGAGTGGTAGSPPFDTPPGPQAGGGSTIDGEYHRVDDDRTQLTERKP